MLNILNRIRSKIIRLLGGDDSKLLEPDFVEETNNNRVNIFQDTVHSGWFKQNDDELFEGFHIASTDVVLDVGCGDSPFLTFCADRGAEIIFADIDKSNVDVTYKNLKKTKASSLTPLVTDSNPLPLEEGTATKIISMEVIEHVDDPEKFLSELFRVGKSGAQYLLTVPDPVAENIQSQGLAPAEYFQKPNHVRVIGREEFKAMVEDAGLVIEKYESYGFFKSMWWIFFWVCKQDLNEEPLHPLLASWTKTWEELLTVEDGVKVKKVLDQFMPKSQLIIARKP
jgi:2-polyprenyl-3-methyl-5-hydroxy-6-metoxy-1,4-benzoquinol methylase